MDPQTWRSEPALAEKIHIAHEMNKHYLHAKWSPAWQAHIEGDVYPHPFNNEALPVLSDDVQLGLRSA
jgi:hypothetical protein